jgi:tetraprenyl-beta-curcumene synthase
VNTEAQLGWLALARAYATFAARYWLNVLPCGRRYMREWRERARRIPDPVLRSLALEAQNSKTGNVEGAAAFAAFVPRARRRTVVRAQVAFQTMYDYLDTLSEQPSRRPHRNAGQLHRALVDALHEDARAGDYYAQHARRNDGGYLQALVSTCRTAVLGLPSYSEIATPVQALADHVVAYQALSLSQRDEHNAFAQWANEEAPLGAELAWWEMAAAGGSSLGVCALMAAAARADLTYDDASAIRAAYWPWVESLHTLLDGVVDEAEDEACGRPSFLSYYASPSEAAGRLRAIAVEAMRKIGALPDAPGHAVIVAAMIGFYLYPAPRTATGALASRAVLESLGFLANPTLLMFRTRRTIRRVGALRSRAFEMPPVPDAQAWARSAHSVPSSGAPQA